MTASELETALAELGWALTSSGNGCDFHACRATDSSVQRNSWSADKLLKSCQTWNEEATNVRRVRVARTFR